MRLKAYYNTILSQTYSPCGSYLVVGDIYGQISVFNLQHILNPSEDYTTPGTSDRKPRNSFTANANIQINSLLTTPNFLVVGTLGEITGYSWPNVIRKKDLQPSWKIELPNQVNNFEKIEINCLLFDEERETLLAGCSDNKIYSINIETGTVLHTLDKHKDYIHSIVNQGNNLISGGEDGLVCFWDVRLREAVHSIEPYKNSKLERPELGKWIGAVALNHNWLLCGGGPRLSLWHYGTMSMSHVYPIEDSGIHVGSFYRDNVFAGGRCPNFYQMGLNGEIVSVIKTSSLSIFSAAIQAEPYKAMCLSGSSPYIDICSSFTHKDQVLTLDYEV